MERSGDDGKIYGDLTIRGVTKLAVLIGHFLRLGFEASTTVKGLDCGVKWNRAVEGGGMMLWNGVTIDIAVEALHQGRRG